MVVKHFITQKDRISTSPDETKKKLHWQIKQDTHITTPAIPAE